MTAQIGPMPVNQHPLYARYIQMIARCEKPDHPAFPNYGGRGISVCAEWRHDFWRYVTDLGPIPEGEGWTVDRINNDGNYQPGNVRWARRVDQNRNRRRDYGLIGELSPRAKVTDAQAREIKESVLSGVHRSVIVQRYGISRSTISRIVRGERGRRN